MRLPDGRYFHIDEDGTPAYSQRRRYAGDFKDGYAVVQRDDGRHSHIDPSGALVHGRWFLDLDVFHKNFARARDEQGWHHVDIHGTAAIPGPLQERGALLQRPGQGGRRRRVAFGHRRSG